MCVCAYVLWHDVALRLDSSGKGMRFFLRKADPFSPYLIVIVMEAFSRLMERMQ